MKKGGKKGQANVITIVLIILIVIVAFLIIWNVVSPLVMEKSEGIGVSESLLGVNLEVKEAISILKGAMWVTVSRGAGKGDLTGLRFIFYDDKGESYAETEETIPEELGAEVYSFSPVLGFGEIKKVSVVPIIGNKLGREFETEFSEVVEIPESLVSWWRFDDGGDEMGVNNGVLAGGAEIAGGVLILNSGYFDANNTELGIVKKKAISLWANPEKDSGGLIKKGSNYELILENSRVKFFSLESSDSVEINKWNHIVVSFDLDGLSKIYVNGDEEIADYLEVNLGEDGESVKIGENFQGKIDEVMIFSEPLSGTQAGKIYEVQEKTINNL